MATSSISRLPSRSFILAALSRASLARSRQCLAAKRLGDASFSWRPFRFKVSKHRTLPRKAARSQPQQVPQPFMTQYAIIRSVPAKTALYPLFSRANRSSVARGARALRSRHG